MIPVIAVTTTLQYKAETVFQFVRKNITVIVVGDLSGPEFISNWSEQIIFLNLTIQEKVVSGNVCGDSNKKFRTQKYRVHTCYSNGRL